MFPLQMLHRGILKTSQVSRSLLTIQSRAFSKSRSRFNKSVKAPSPVAKPNARKALYPERYIIYHAGTGRTVFLGCLKVTTIFIFSFFSLVLVPAHFKNEDQPKWVAPAVLVSGLVPLVFVTYITSPFATYIHLILPPFARHSKDILLRYSQHLPKDAKLEITSMNFIGRPRATRMPINKVFAVNERFGLVNFRYDAESANSSRKWYMRNLKQAFGVHSGKQTVGFEGQVWKNVKECISRNGSMR